MIFLIFVKKQFKAQKNLFINNCIEKVTKLANI